MKIYKLTRYKYNMAMLFSCDKNDSDLKADYNKSTLNICDCFELLMNVYKPHFSKYNGEKWCFLGDDNNSCVDKKASQSL